MGLKVIARTKISRKKISVNEYPSKLLSCKNFSLEKRNWRNFLSRKFISRKVISLNICSEEILYPEKKFTEYFSKRIII